jgi:4-amino-4-deoxy-L-arabinose transferase-like glycosyltransferase
MWAALPLLLSDRVEPGYASLHWGRAAAWEFGFEFLNGPLWEPQRKNPQRLLVPARVMMLVPAVLLALVVYAWAREAGGQSAGLVALFLFALSPTMLAHARLVTADLPAALAYTGSVWCLWRYTQRPGWRRAIMLGGAVGAALLTKLTMLILLPVAVLLGGVWGLWGGAAAARSRRLVQIGVGLGGAAVVAWLCVWAVYRFRYPASPDPTFVLPWQDVSLPYGAAAAAIDVTRRWRLLPEAFLYGLAFYARVYAQANPFQPSFLNGELSADGWWYYFPEAFLLKTTPALFALLLWALWAQGRRWRGRALGGWFLAVPAALYVLQAMGARWNIGHRLLTPLYPFLFILAGVHGARVLAASSVARRIALVLFASHAVSSVAAFPSYLSYFNAIAGGPAGGWRYLVDSNIDWGQDLLRLKAWMDERGVREVHLAYFGTGDPRAYGIAYRPMQMYLDFRQQEPKSQPEIGEVLAASVTLLQGAYITNPAARPLLRQVRDTLHPIGRAGDSILIYRMPPLAPP